LRTLLAERAAFSADPAGPGWYVTACQLPAIDATGSHLLVSCGSFGRLDRALHPAARLRPANGGRRSLVTARIKPPRHQPQRDGAGAVRVRATASAPFRVDDPLSRDACGTQDSHQPSPVVCHCGKAVKGLSIWPAAVRIDVEILPPS
jgi:hypothetical protein